VSEVSRATGGLPVTTSNRLSERLGYGAGWLTGALPLGMQGDEFLVRFVSIFEEVATTMRSAADSVTRAADVDVTTPGMIRYLASWVGAQALDSRLALDHQREIARATGAVLGRRGTADAVRTVLGALTRGEVEIDDDGGVFREGAAAPSSGHVHVRAASLGHLREQELVDLVLAMVPANLTVTVECAGAVLYPAQEQS
jgi:phage tail-like protein